MPILSGAHEMPQDRGNLQSTDMSEKIRIHRSAHGFSESHRSDPGSPLDHSYAQSADEGPKDPTLPTDKAQMISLIKEHLNQPQIEVLSSHSHKSRGGRRSVDFSFTLHSMPIDGYRVRGIKKPNGDLVIRGDIPNAHYDSENFENLHELNRSPVQLKAIATEQLSQFHKDIDEDLIEIASSYRCVVNHNHNFVPSLCVTVQYNTFSFYTSAISKDGALWTYPLGYHYCGIIKDVHILNRSSQKRSFSVSLCDPDGKRNILANEKFIFASKEPLLTSCASEDSSPFEVASEYKAQNSSTKTPAGRFSLQRDISSIKALLFYLTKKSNRPIETLWSSSADPLSPWKATGVNGVFGYHDDDPYTQRKVHLFSYLNRMINWFESLGFEIYDHPLVVMISDMPCALPPSNASYVFYQAQSNSLGLKTLHTLMFGFPGAVCDGHPYSDHRRLYNIAMDMDIPAHELSHYIVARWIPGNPQKSYGTNNHTAAIHEGIADYFTYAATGDDCLGNTVFDNPDGEPSNRCLRSARPKFRYKDSTYEEYADHRVPRIHYIGQLVSGMLWDVREQTDKADRPKLDKVVLGSLHYSPPQNVTYEDLLSALIESDQEYTQGGFCERIISSARKYNFIDDDTAQDITDRQCPKDLYTAYAADHEFVPTTGPPLSETFEPYRVTNIHSLECMGKGSDIELLTGIDLSQQNPYQRDQSEQRQTGRFISSGCSGTTFANTNDSHSAPHHASGQTLLWLWLISFPLILRVPSIRRG